MKDLITTKIYSETLEELRELNKITEIPQVRLLGRLVKEELQRQRSIASNHQIEEVAA